MALAQQNIFDDRGDWWTEDDLPDPSLADLIQPTGWRLVVRPMAPKSKTMGGVILPQSSADLEAATQTVGRVLAIGNLCWNGDRFYGPGDLEAASWAEVGEFVLYGKYAGQKLTCAGVKILILNDDEITAVVPNPDVVKKA